MQMQMTDNSSGAMVAEIQLSPRHVPRISDVYVKGLRVSMDPMQYQVRMFFFLNFLMQNCWTLSFKDWCSNNRKKCFHPFMKLSFNNATSLTKMFTMDGEKKEVAGI